MLLAQSAHAAPTCKANEVYVPNWGCVLKSEVAKAKATCAKILDANKKKVAFTDCLCKDGNEIGACGD